MFNIFKTLLLYLMCYNESIRARKNNCYKHFDSNPDFKFCYLKIELPWFVSIPWLVLEIAVHMRRDYPQADDSKIYFGLPESGFDENNCQEYRISSTAWYLCIVHSPRKVFNA